MNYKNPELQRQLASEYVLGTLSPRARLRFERLLRNDADLRAEVVAWQEKLMPLASALPSISPPRRVWRGIEARLGLRAAMSSRLAFWRGLGLLSSVLSALLIVYVMLGPRVGSEQNYIALINDEQAKPAWLLSTRDNILSMKALTPRPVAANQALELWLLPRSGKPISLGLMPISGSKQASLSDKVREQFTQASAIAVSLEPAGGSPTGQPTGPVLYQAPLIHS